MTESIFWQVLDALPDLAAARAEWHRLLGDEFESCTPYLRPTGQIAQSLPRANDLAYRIVCHDSDDYVGVPPEGGPTIQLTKADVTLYELHQRKLGEAITGTLKLERQIQALDGVSNAWLLGRANQPGKMRHPVFMAFRMEESEYREITMALGRQYPKGFVFLSPTGQPRSETPGAIFSMNRLFRIAADSALVPMWTGETWLVDAPIPYPESARKEWPDPAVDTMVMVWTTKNGSFWIRSKKGDQKEGKAEFPMGTDGTPGKQSQLLRLLVFKHPTPMPVSEVLQQVYPEDLAAVRVGRAQLAPLLKKCRTLFSDLRDKLEKAEINPRIVPALSIDTDKTTDVVLQVTSVRNMDDHGLDDADKASF